MANTARCKECDYAGRLGEFKLFKDVKLYVCPLRDSMAVKVFRNVPACTYCDAEPSLPPSNLCAACETCFKADATGKKIDIPLICDF